MYTSDHHLIHPFDLAESQFLQVLLDAFSLDKTGNGTTLSVAFDGGTPAINTRQAKYNILRSMGTCHESKARAVQAEIDGFFTDPTQSTYRFSDAGLPFRYASGGALPIVSVDGRSYFCLFYRDIFPIGWNIANGGCDNRSELFNPSRTIERELCEELVVVNPLRRKRYIFERNKSRFVEGFDHEHYGYSELMLPIRWIEGPDSIVVRFDGSPDSRTDGYFLNITAADFGIEADKIAHIRLDPDDVLASGEILHGHEVNTPIGLFDTDRFIGHETSEDEDVIPDLFFFNGTKHDGGNFREVVERDFIPYIGKHRSDEEHAHWEQSARRFSLCPVTRHIISKYRTSSQPHILVPKIASDLYVSFSEPDRSLAERVAAHLVARGKRVFIRPAGMAHDERMSADRALTDSSTLIAVGSSRRNLIHYNASYEYRNFYRDTVYGRKGTTSRIITLAVGMDREDMPPPLCYSYSVACSGVDGFDRALAELDAMLATDPSLYPNLSQNGYSKGKQT